MPFRHEPSLIVCFQGSFLSSLSRLPIGTLAVVLGLETQSHVVEQKSVSLFTYAADIQSLSVF